jgi:hypothetical protein
MKGKTGDVQAVQDRRQRPSLKLDLIPSTIPDYAEPFIHNSFTPMDSPNQFHFVEPVPWRSVSGRLCTPKPLIEELEWLELQDEAEAMREYNIDGIDLSDDDSPILSNTKLSSKEPRPSSAAFKNFCSLPFTRSGSDGNLRQLDPFERNKQQDNAGGMIQPGAGETIIYSTGPTPMSMNFPFNCVSPTSDLSSSTSPKRLDRAAANFVPGQTAHDALSSSQWRLGEGRLLTPYSALG